MSLIGPVDSEKMFENVDRRMPERLVYYKLTDEPLAQVS